MKILLPLLLALAPTMSLADAGTMHLIQPKGSTLKIIAVQRETGTSARFSGRTWVHGTFVARWWPGAGRKDEAPDYLLIPDRASIQRLPYFFLRESGFANRYRVRQIEIENGAEALNIVAGRTRARELLDHRRNRVEIVGSFLITGYSVGVECDAPWAKARLEKANIPSNTASLSLQIPESC
jgi:hypothetical protein